MPRDADPALDPALLDGPALAETALGGWHTLNPLLMRLSRQQVAFLLRAELLGRRREPLLTRLHQRLSQLRRVDEWATLVEAARGLGNGGALDEHRFGPLAWLWRELAP